MTSKPELKKLLDSLIIDADEQQQLHEGSRQKLYFTLAGIYLWWRTAKDIEGFLEEIYEEKRLKKRGVEENFTRLIRLVWQTDWNHRTPKVQQWSNALQKLHTEFETNRDAYKVEPRESLRQYIDSQGGISGLLGIKGQDEDQYASSGKKKSKSKPDPQIDEAVRDKHFELGELYFSGQARSLIDIDAARLDVTRKGYALALVRRKANSKYQILSVTNDDALVKDAIIATYKRKSDATPYVLRLLGEVIETQSLPLTLERHRASFNAISDALAANGDKLKQVKRLILRPKSKDILLSECRNDCSVVTIATPLEFPVTCTEDLFLRIPNQRFVENEIIQTRDMSFFTTLSKKIEAVKDPELKASHVLTAKNSVTGRIRNLYFYRVSTMAEGSKPQAVVYKHGTTAPVWQATVNKGWIDDLFSICVSIWLRDCGSRINQSDHKQVQLALGKKTFLVRYCGSNGKYTDRYKDIPNPSVAVKSKPCAIHVLSKDIFPVLNALAHQDIVGNVRLMANADLLAIQYATATAKYSIAVPACTVKGKRIKTAFTGYGA